MRWVDREPPTNLPPSNVLLTANILIFWSCSMEFRGTGLVLVHTTEKKERARRAYAQKRTNERGRERIRSTTHLRDHGPNGKGTSQHLQRQLQQPRSCSRWSAIAHPHNETILGSNRVKGKDKKTRSTHIGIAYSEKDSRFQSRSESNSRQNKEISAHLNGEPVLHKRSTTDVRHLGGGDVCVRGRKKRRREVGWKVVSN